MWQCRPACLFPFLLSSTLASGSVLAQSPVEGDVIVYHGSQSQSGAIAYLDDHGVRHSTSQRRVELRRFVGDSVCVRVENGHPALYVYGSEVEVEPLAVVIPDVGALVSALSKLLSPGILPTAEDEPAEDRERRAARTEPERPSSLKRLGEFVEALRNEVETFRTFTTSRSDEPESVAEVVDGERVEERGFRYAQRKIRSLSDDPGHFNDPQLAARLTALADTARVDTRFDNELRTEAAALATLADALVKERDLYKRAYDEADPTPTVCRRAGDGISTIRFSAKARGKGKRDTGELVTIRVQPLFDRPFLELTVSAFVAYLPDLPRFLVRDGGIQREEEGKFLVHPGAQLHMNAFRWGSRDQFAFGPFLGFGASNESILADVAVGVGMSFRDVLRLGIGVGGSDVPSRLPDTAMIGGPVPEGKKLDELLEEERRAALYLTIGLKGIDIPVPGAKSENEEEGT